MENKTITKDDIINELNNSLEDFSFENKKNKGSGAGGANTNFHGKHFENITSIENLLLSQNYIKEKIDENDYKTKNKFNYMIYNENNQKKIIYLTQIGLKNYIKKKYNIEIFRHPDEAFIIEEDGKKSKLKILEKKEQNVEGSCMDKIWNGGAFKREYEIMIGEYYDIEYSYCLSDFLKKKIESKTKKFEIFMQIMDEYKIKIFYGKDEDYFDKIYEWINN